MFVFFPLVHDVKWLMVSPSKIIASRPKTRKPGNRRGVGRAEVPGKKDPAVSARARYSTTTPGTGKPTPAPPQAGEKIIVSNLPTDVNEAQIKVCSRLLQFLCPLCSLVVPIGIIPLHNRTSQGCHSSLRCQRSLKGSRQHHVPKKRRRKQSLPAVQQPPH